MRLRATLLCALLALTAAVIACVALWAPAHPVLPNLVAAALPALPAATPSEVTQIYGHNLELRQGPVLRIYTPWLRGQLVPTHRGEIPSLDRRDSFYLHIDRGVVRLQLDNLARFLSSGEIAHAPFTHVELSERHGQMVMHAIVHKVIPLPAELVGNLHSAGGNEIAFDVTSVHVLKVPMHGLMDIFHLKIGSLFRSKAAGIRAQGNTIFFDAETLPPAPHLSGDITRVQVVAGPGGGWIETVYGNAHDDSIREQRWRDFLELKGGSLSFGKLTMRDLDLILIDRAAKDPWFDLDLANYQSQLVYGITRVTPQAGLQIYMPSVEELPDSEPSATITREWLRDRDLPSPPSAPVH